VTAVATAPDRAAFRQAVDEVLTARAAAFDAAGRVPDDVLRRLGELGWWGSAAASRHGGLGLGHAATAVLHEEVGRACASTRGLLGAHGMVAWAIGRWGTDGQQGEWLPRLAAGEVLAGFCLTEPGVGSDAGAVTATATLGEGGWRLDGHKVWVTGGLDAGVFLVFARTPAGVSAFLVPRGASGLTVTPRTGLLGIRASGTADVTLDGCRVPAGALLGTEGFALPTVLMGALDIGRLSVAAGCVGILQACLDASVARVTARASGDGMLADRQLVRRLVADMATDLAAARLLVAEAARLKDAGDPETIAATWRAKYFAAGAARRAATEAVQLHGADGCADDAVPARCYRDAKVMELIEGSTELSQLVVADQAYRDRDAP